MTVAAKVYWIRLPHHTDVFKEGYVGFTTQVVRRRFARHVRDAKNHRPMSRILASVLRRDASKVLVQAIVVGDPGYCLELENKLRPTPNIGWNVLAGGEGGALGLKPHPDTVAKQTAAKIGRPRSPETRAKLSLALRGNKCALGSKRTEAHKVRARARRVGVPRGQKIRP